MQFTSRTNKNFINYNNTKKGEVIAVGRLVGSTENSLNPNLRDWQIKPLEKGAKIIHLFGTGQLEWAMKDIEEGTIVQITYLGKEKIDNKKHKFNGVAAHNFDVAVADDLEDEEEVFTPAEVVEKKAPLNAKKVKEVEKLVKESKAQTAKESGKTVDLSDLD
jgi:predicted RNA-binding protein with PUA domain